MKPLVPLLLLGGCVIGGDRYTRPRDLAPAWLVDRTRVLGIRANPPEIAPGQTSVMESLVYDPDDRELGVVWLACETDGENPGCELDLGTIDFENADPEELAALGFIGFEPFFPPSYTAPSEILDDLDPEARAEGKYIQLQVSALPAEVLEEQVDELDLNDIEIATKRLVVSAATTPNANPLLSDFQVDGYSAKADNVVLVDVEQSYDLSILLMDGARQQYEFVTSTGETEVRVEEPYAAWYATGGTVLEPYTLHPYMTSTWTAPDEPEEGTWFVVVRDRRGGMAWRTVQWKAE